MIKERKMRFRRASMNPEASTRAETRNQYPRSFYTTRGESMSLTKTAQLNVYELLRYLDHDDLKESMAR